MRERVLKGLAGVHPAVHEDRLGRDERIRDERVYDLRDLLWAAEPANRYARGELRA